MAVQCTKCGSGVSETASQCPICFNPMGQAPAAPEAPSAAAPPAVPASAVPGAPPAPPMSAPAAPPMPPAGVPQAAVPPAPPAQLPGIPNLMGQVDGPPAYTPSAGSMGSMGGNVRVSLTGEVMEVAPPTPRPTAPAGAPPRAGMPAPPSGPARPQRYGVARDVPQEKKGSSAGVVVGVIVLLLVLGGGAFAWWRYQTQRGPALAAEKVVAAIQKNDWLTILNMIEYSPEQAAALDKAPGGRNQAIMVGANMLQAVLATVKFHDTKVGEVTVNGDTATVKVTMTADLPTGSKTNTNDMAFKLVKGEWKLDASKMKNTGGLPGMEGLGGGMGGMGGGMGGPGGMSR